VGNSDPVLSYLKSFGYSVVRLPRADIRPLQVLTKEDTRLSRLGELATVLQPRGHITSPTVHENVSAATISGQRTRELSFGVGLSILGSIIGAMGGSKLGLDVTYKQARTVAFEFADVTSDGVELVDIDQYLTDADLSPFSTHVAKLLESDAIYVTTSTIKSRKFVVEAKQSDGTALEVKIPDIQGIVGGNVTVSASGGAASKVVYEGAVPLVFGFQAARLFYENGRYTAFRALSPGNEGLEARPEGDYLVTDSPFVRLETP